MQHAAKAIAAGDTRIYVNAHKAATLLQLNMQLSRGLNTPQLTQQEVEMRRAGFELCVKWLICVLTA
jgi:hypothetical protein